MQQVELNQLLEAGVHFGHQTRRWNPKMRTYIFTEKNGIHIIDLRKTLDRLQAAQNAVRGIVLRGERVLFVCTKKQLRPIVEEEAQRCGRVLRDRAVVGRYAHQLPDHSKPDPETQGIGAGPGGRTPSSSTRRRSASSSNGKRLRLDKYFSGGEGHGPPSWRWSSWWTPSVRSSQSGKRTGWESRSSPLRIQMRIRI